MAMFLMLATIICLLASPVVFIVGLVRLLLKKGWKVLLYSVLLFILSIILYRVGAVVFAVGKLINLR